VRIDVFKRSYQVFFFRKVQREVLREIRGGLLRGGDIRKVALKVIGGTFKGFWNGT